MTVLNSLWCNGWVYTPSLSYAVTALRRLNVTASSSTWLAQVCIFPIQGIAQYHWNGIDMAILHKRSITGASRAVVCFLPPFLVRKWTWKAKLSPAFGSCLQLMAVSDSVRSDSGDFQGSHLSSILPRFFHWISWNSSQAHLSPTSFFKLDLASECSSRLALFASAFQLHIRVSSLDQLSLLSFY